MARSESAVRRAIDGLKLDDVLARVIDERRWPEERAQEALLWYRRFLWLSYKHWKTGVHAINRDSDELWHAHITYTRKYSRDCEQIFGRFLDHNPVAGRLTPQDRKLLDQSVEWYREEFQAPPPDPIGQCYKPPGPS